MSTAAVFAVAPGSARGLKVSEYDALVEAGLLDDERVELVEGALVNVSPQRPAHAQAVYLAGRALAEQAATGWIVRSQLPFVAGELSEPEPDLAVVPDADYGTRHPASAVLIIEVARSSRAMNLGIKAEVYAAVGVTEYWVLDLPSRCLHVHRQPTPRGYADVVVHEDGPVSMASAPHLGVDLDLLLPPRT